MNVLFMMPGWKDGSGPWMTRMMETFGNDLKAIVVKNSKGENCWKREVPIYSIRHRRKAIHYMSRLLSICGITSLCSTPDPNRLLKKIIRSHSISHVLCQYGTFAVNFMDIWQKTDVSLFVHFHGYDQTFDLRSYDRPQEKRFDDSYLQDIKTLSQHAIFVANSQFSKKILVDSGINETRIRVKYICTPLPDNKKQHVKTKDLKIIQLGRLVDCKSPDRTIKAFEIAKSKGFCGSLTLVGDGPLRITCELLRSRSNWKDSIHILGHVTWEQGQYLLSEADIYTQHNITGELTHQTEALGVSILEAMSFGLPVIATRNGGVLETVVDNETGLLNDPGDVEAQADSFIKLAHDPELRQSMGDAGRKRIEECFTEEQEAEQLKKIMTSNYSIHSN
mgnify:CR=1 FL=1